MDKQGFWVGVRGFRVAHICTCMCHMTMCHVSYDSMCLVPAPCHVSFQCCVPSDQLPRGQSGH
jgi:hypothetical protein